MAQKNKHNSSPYKKKNQGKVQKRSRGHLVSENIYSLEEANDRLYDIFKNHNFEHIQHDQRLQLAKYYQLMMAEQKYQNFTRILEFRDIAIKQFIDCLIIDRLCKLSFPLLDIGTGPGLPGIPLKILYPNEYIYLAEGVQKRVEFLKRVRVEMNLNKLKIFGRNINWQFVYPVNGVITRAVEDISNTLYNVRHCLQNGGHIYFMKGPNVDEELDLALNEHKEYYSLKENISYDLPHTSHKRRLVIIQKIKPHPLIDLEKIIDSDYEDEEKYGKN